MEYRALPSATLPHATYPAPIEQDTYLKGIAITAATGAGLLILIGFFVVLLIIFMDTLLSALTNTNNSTYSTQFALLIVSIVYGMLASIYIVSGSIILYHSIRSLRRKPSARFSLPPFWIGLIDYIAVIAIGYALNASLQGWIKVVVSLCLICLAALLPAIALLAWSVRFFPSISHVITWRRITTAFISAATVSVSVALLLEMLILVGWLITTPNFSCIFHPYPSAACTDNRSLSTILLPCLFLIIPLIDETVKPLMIAVCMPRIPTRAEALLLGLASGVGFGFAESIILAAILVANPTYNSWIDVALVSISFSVLQGIGSALVTLGWHHLVHKNKLRFLKAFAFWLCAVVIHSIFYITWLGALLPIPIGPAIRDGQVPLGLITLPLNEVIVIFEALILLILFLLLVRNIKRQTSAIVKLSTTMIQ